MYGVFIGEGSDVRISARNLRLNLASGEIDPVVLDVRIDTWNHWIVVAREAQSRANAALVDVRASHESGDNVALGLALEEEFRNGMTAISAAAFAVDAFYASVKERHAIHPQSAAWQAGRLARYKQVAETLRWAWNVKPESAKVIRGALKQLYNFRDSAVHSPAEFRTSLMRSDIERGVEWRFVHFRAENADNAVRVACEVIEAFLRSSQKAPVSLREWVIASRSRFAVAAGYEVREPDEPQRRAIEQ
jgi:hypothetical protein